MTTRETGWAPTVEQGSDPLHARLQRTIARDISAGRLAPGDRLPTHRDLAYRLGIGIGTVTRAYAEAETQGLVTSHVGRGTFVAAQPVARSGHDGPLDLAHNLAPAAPSEGRIKAAIATIGRRRDLATHLTYAPSAGFDTHRRAGAAWIEATSGLRPDWTRLIVTAGAQQAMSLLFGCLCRHGDGVLVEAATYVGMRSCADQAGLRLHGVAMDHEGLDPGALDRAASETGARVLYTLPTLQNPTGRLMSPARRDAIARVARKRDLWIVEDDIYAAYVRPAPQPLASLVPERTFLISGVSKVLGPGLRTGYLVVPSKDWFDRLGRATRAACYAPPTFGSLIATQWIEDGSAAALVDEVNTEVAARRVMAESLLGDLADQAAGDGPHLWLPLPEYDAERVAGQVQRHGIEVTPPTAPIVDRALASGLRLCLGAVRERSALARALETIASAVRSTGAISVNGII